MLCTTTIFISAWALAPSIVFDPLRPAPRRSVLLRVHSRTACLTPNRGGHMVLREADMNHLRVAAMRPVWRCTCCAASGYSRRRSARGSGRFGNQYSGGLMHRRIIMPMCLALCAAMLFSALSVMAQVNTATLSGTVMDPQGLGVKGRHGHSGKLRHRRATNRRSRRHRPLQHRGSASWKLQSDRRWRRGLRQI